MSDSVPFRLRDTFLQNYKDEQPNWGPLGYITYKRTYSRRKADGTYEEFWETCQRVVEGVFWILSRHLRSIGKEFNPEEYVGLAEDMFQRMWEFKWLPPGRGLWMMGTDYVKQMGHSTPLQNCGFVSTKDIATDGLAAPYTWMMDALMLGVGVGFDTRGAGSLVVSSPTKGTDTFVVEDTREGWVALLGRYLDAYSGRCDLPDDVDYSLVRPEGSPINGFGGTASGPGPLRDLVAGVSKVLSKNVGEPITSGTLVDIGNLVGRCVVAGNVRRSALLALGDRSDDLFLSLKDPDKYPEELMAWRWSSNNSILADSNTDYSRYVDSISKNGEPGVLWLDRTCDYGRLKDPPDYKDHLALGTNPCVTGDTLVDTAQGKRPVSDLVGTSFTAVVHSEEHPSTSEGFWKTGHKEVFLLSLDSGHSLKATADHEILTQDDQEQLWVALKDLRVGDAVVLSVSNGPPVSSVVSITPCGFEDVYDCTIPSIHRFVANGIVVHNCGEQTLFDKELCCLVESFPHLADDAEDFLKTIKVAFLYAKVVTLLPSHFQQSTEVMNRNRRIGLSMSGITQAITKFGYQEFLDLADKGYSVIKSYDNELSYFLCVPESIKVTSVKPSGTVSLLAGASPGVHFPHSEYYIRRIRFQSGSPLVTALELAGYSIEKDAYSPNTSVVEFPVRESLFSKSKDDVSMTEQMQLAADLQRFWADNQVSVTVTFTKEEATQLGSALNEFASKLKSVSFLPLQDHGYVQAPYEAISKEKYEEMISKVVPSNTKEFAQIIAAYAQHDQTERFCDGGVCAVSADNNTESPGRG